MPRATARITVPDGVLMQQLPDDELVFLNLATEEYYGLDSIGATMWRALTDTGRVDLACDRLLEVYDVDRETLHRDLDALVSRLAERGLLDVDRDAA